MAECSSEAVRTAASTATDEAAYYVNAADGHRHLHTAGLHSEADGHVAAYNCGYNTYEYGYTYTCCDSSCASPSDTVAGEMSDRVALDPSTTSNVDNMAVSSAASEARTAAGADASLDVSVVDTNAANFYTNGPSVVDFQLSLGPESILPYSVNAVHRKQLQDAIRAGDIDTVQAMLDRNVDPNMQDERGTSLLHYASANGQSAIVKLLLQCRGIDVNIQEIGGWTPLHLACNGKHRDVVAMLVAQPRIRVDTPDCDGWTSLYYASIDESISVMALLVDKGANVNIQDSHGSTMLHHCCLRSAAESARWLLQHGASVDIQDRSGLSAMHHACLAGRYSIVDLLFRRGASLMRRDMAGATPFHLLMDGSKNDMVEQVVHRCSNDRVPMRMLKATNEDGASPLSIAERFSSTETMETLIRNITQDVIARQSGDFDFIEDDD